MELGKARSTEEIIKDIKSVLETKVKDNVAVHGGEINFLSYEKGIVRLQMAGACSGCAMSKKTLHEGVERLLVHYVPEVIGLLGEDDEEAKVQMPMKTVASLIAMVAIGTWAFFGIQEKLNQQATQLKIMEKDLVENTEFRIKWPRGLL